LERGACCAEAFERLKQPPRQTLQKASTV